MWMSWECVLLMMQMTGYGHLELGVGVFHVDRALAARRGSLLTVTGLLALDQSQTGIVSGHVTRSPPITAHLVCVAVAQVELVGGLLLAQRHLGAAVVIRHHVSRRRLL